MSQPRHISALESTVNIAVGLVLSYAATIIMLPALGIPITNGQNAIITAVMTALSFVRSYGIRRAFERYRL